MIWQPNRAVKQDYSIMLIPFKVTFHNLYFMFYTLFMVLSLPIRNLSLLLSLSSGGAITPIMDNRETAAFRSECVDYEWMKDE